MRAVSVRIDAAKVVLMSLARAMRAVRVLYARRIVWECLRACLSVRYACSKRAQTAREGADLAANP